MQDIRLGIDFGTTTTAVSLKIGNALPVVLPIGKDSVTQYIPSVAYFPPGGVGSLAEVTVGEDAVRSAGRGSVVHSIKRCLGCRGNRCKENKAANSYWCTGDGKTTIPHVGVFEPSEIALLIVQEAVKRALEYSKEEYGIDIADSMTLDLLNMGCPAAFDLSEREILVEIAHQAGFAKVSIENIVEEPILAGFTFSRFAPQTEGRVLVYDFGGGSFDTAILDIRRVSGSQKITVLATAGELWLGGDDIDTLINQYFIDEIVRNVGSNEKEVRRELEPIDIWTLRSFAKRAKENLSSSADFSDAFFSDAFRTVPLDLTRSQLENLIRSSRMDGKNLIERSLETVLRACKLSYAFDVAQEHDLLPIEDISHYSLENAASQINQVVMVGGISKMPIVRKAVARIFGEKKIVSETVVEPIAAVAFGAAYPRDPQHYSLAYPPFEITLELHEHKQGRAEPRKIFVPYEHYRFHEAWAYNALPLHRSDPLVLLKSYASGRLGLRKIGSQIWKWQDIGPMTDGTWRFFVGLEGKVSYQYGTEARQELGHLPEVHPVQAAIEKNRAGRQAKKEEALKRNLDNSMFHEN